MHDAATTVIPPAGRYVVIAPHPDDEVLTVGGLIARLVSSGAEVVVVGVTDGGNAYPGVVDHDELARTRHGEQAACVERLGLSADCLVSLGIDDGSVPQHEDELVDRIVDLCTATTTIVAPWVHDVHTDHEAVGRAARRAAAVQGCSLWFSLFWAWHHTPVDDLRSHDLIRVDLDDDLRATKAAALDCHASQLDAGDAPFILDGHHLEPARWNAEYFIPDTVRP